MFCLFSQLSHYIAGDMWLSPIYGSLQSSLIQETTHSQIDSSISDYVKQNSESSKPCVFVKVFCVAIFEYVFFASKLFTELFRFLIIFKGLSFLSINVVFVLLMLNNKALLFIHSFVWDDNLVLSNRRLCTKTLCVTKPRIKKLIYFIYTYTYLHNW